MGNSGLITNRDRGFSVPYSFQTGFVVQIAFCPTGTNTPSPRVEVARSAKLTTQLHLVLRLKVGGAIPPFPRRLYVVGFN
jgi:hypothetical protein